MLFLLLQMTMPMTAAPAPRIEMANTTGPVEVPAVHRHHDQISAGELADSTIEYCRRTGQTRCRNNVSAISGGACIEVRLSRGRWYWVNCRQRPQ